MTHMCHGGNRVTFRFVTNEELTKQQRRTRSALLASASQMLAEGRTPTVVEVADAALVSRRTAYRYFPSAEQLLADAALDALDPVIASTITAADPAERVDTLVAQLNEHTRTQQHLLRTILRATLDTRQDAGGPLRGFRRMGWIEQAIAPLSERLDADALRRLAAALALTVGLEARLSLVDVAGLDDEVADQVSRWAANALVQAALASPDEVGMPPESTGRTPQRR